MSIFGNANRKRSGTHQGIRIEGTTDIRVTQSQQSNIVRDVAHIVTMSEIQPRDTKNSQQGTYSKKTQKRILMHVGIMSGDNPDNYQQNYKLTSQA